MLRSSALALALALTAGCASSSPPPSGDLPSNNTAPADLLGDGPRTEVKGALTPEQVSSTIQRSLPTFEACYTAEYRKDPAVAGEVRVRFSITADGAVRDATLAESNVTNAELETCMVAAVKALRFPAPSDGGEVEVTHPFVLRAPVSQ